MLQPALVPQKRRAALVRSLRALFCSFQARAESESMAGALILVLAALKDLKMHEFKLIDHMKNIDTSSNEK